MSVKLRKNLFSIISPIASPHDAINRGLVPSGFEIINVFENRTLSVLTNSIVVPYLFTPRYSIIVPSVQPSQLIASLFKCIYTTVKQVGITPERDVSRLSKIALQLMPIIRGGEVTSLLHLKPCSDRFSQLRMYLESRRTYNMRTIDDHKEFQDSSEV